MLAGLDRRRVLSWATYDFANSAFATTVMAGFFPVYFHDHWNAGVEATEVSFRLGAANSLAGVLVALSAPLLGAMADRGGTRKRMLFGFTVAGAALTAGLALIAAGQWLTAAALYVLATCAFSASNTFYDALLKGLAPDESSDRVSALGLGAGYLGGGLLFALNVWMVNDPGRFGFAGAAAAVRVSFVLVGIWWLLFSLPLFLWVDERRPPRPAPPLAAVRAGARDLLRTLREIRSLKTVFLFLGGYWLYIDGVDTIVRMAASYGRSLGFPSQSLIVALLITQFVGFPAAILFGLLGERIGTRRGIFLALAVYVVVTLWGYRLAGVGEFYALAVLIGLVQGGVQSLSRSLFLRIIPARRAAQFFGFYNMVGKFAVVIGPLLMGAVGRATGNPRTSILAVLVLFLFGGALLARVDEAEGRRAAAEFDAAAGRDAA